MSPSKKKKNRPGCRETSCDRLYLADDDLLGQFSRQAGEPCNKFVRKSYVVIWREGACQNDSIPFKCIGQAEQWVRDHLLPHLVKLGHLPKAEIIVETTFSVREHLGTRQLLKRE